MRSFVSLVLLVCLCASSGLAQRVQAREPSEKSPAESAAKLLKYQHEEIRKLSSRLAELATEVEADLDKGGENVLPLGTLKKLEEIEKLARKIRDRIKQ